MIQIALHVAARKKEEKMKKKKEEKLKLQTLQKYEEKITTVKIHAYDVARK